MSLQVGPRAAAARAPQTACRKADGAISDVLGTLFLLGITVTLVSVAALAVGDQLSTHEEAPPRLDVRAWVREGGSVVHVAHVGGGPVDLGSLRAVVLVNGDVGYAGPAGPAGTVWDVGDTLDVGPLAQPLPSGARVEVTLTLPGTRGDGAMAVVLVPRTTAVPGVSAPTAALRLSGGANVTNVTVDDYLRIEVDAGHTGGRKFIRSVTAELAGTGLPAFPLRDDGAEGDRRARDGVYTLEVAMRKGLLGSHPLKVTVEDLAGNKVTTNGTVHVIRNPVGKAISGTLFEGVASSVNATDFQLKNISWDRAAYKDLKKDVAILRLGDDEGDVWTVHVLFDKNPGNDTQLVLKELTMYSANGGCRWTPSGNLVLDQPLDILYPLQNGDMGSPKSSGGELPAGLPACEETSPGVFTGSYQNAGVDDPATLAFIRFGDRDGKDHKSALISTNVFLQ